MKRPGKPGRSHKKPATAPRRAFEPFEQRYTDRKPALVAGADEVGRGALAGPVTVGYVIFPPAYVLPPSLYDLDDSKMVSVETRHRLHEIIRSEALFSCVVHVSNRFIDKRGISAALEFAFVRCHERALQSGLAVGALLLDGKYKYPAFARSYPELACEAVVKGDRRIMSIAAASILAKVSRDLRMSKYDTIVSGYQFEEHKGYGTELHRGRIQALGPSRLHRQSFSLLGREHAQGQLF
ncbi:MAG: ribonuclease HII [Spirochaetia bacterium]|nr:ribonuclease HII [Spirochaetia bacterium]